MKPFLIAAVASALLAAGAARADDTKPAPAPAVPGAPGAAAHPATAKHENKVSAAAKAAFEKMGKLANNPVAQGLKDAGGTLTMVIPNMPPEMTPPGIKFTFKAPCGRALRGGRLRAGPDGGHGGQVGEGMEPMIRFMLGIFRPSDEGEYDADVTTKGRQRTPPDHSFRTAWSRASRSSRSTPTD